MGNGDYRRFANFRMRDQSVLQIDGTDPLAARLNQGFRPVHDSQIAFGINRSDIAGAKTSVFGPFVVFHRQVVIARGYPGPAQLHFSHSFSVPCNFALLVDPSPFHERNRYSSLPLDFAFRFLRPILHVRFELARRRLWTALGQPPALLQAPSMLPQSLNERE